MHAFDFLFDVMQLLTACSNVENVSSQGLQLACMDCAGQHHRVERLASICTLWLSNSRSKEQRERTANDKLSRLDEKMDKVVDWAKCGYVDFSCWAK